MVYLGGTVVVALLAVVSGCFSFVVLPRAWRRSSDGVRR
jgi:uncharacterized protein YjeT (DUF2065 family)